MSICLCFTKSSLSVTNLCIVDFVLGFFRDLGNILLVFCFLHTTGICSKFLLPQQYCHKFCLNQPYICDNLQYFYHKKDIFQEFCFYFLTRAAFLFFPWQLSSSNVLKIFIFHVLKFPSGIAGQKHSRLQAFS